MMRTGSKSALALLGLALGGALAAAEIAATSADSVRIDGKLTEKAWQEAVWSQNFVQLSGAPAKEQTRFKVISGERGLYFGFEVEDHQIVDKITEHDGSVWVDDAIEIFLSPVSEFSSDSNACGYFQFIFNASGTRYEQKVFGGVGDVGFDTPWKVATRRRDGGFDAEVFLPWHAFFPFSESRTWRLNVGRENRGKESEISSWSPVRTLQEYRSWGTLTGLSVKPDFYNVALGKFRQKGGSDHCTAEVELHGAAARQLALTGVLYDERGKLVGIANIPVFRFDKDGVGKGELNFEKITASGNYFLKLTAVDFETGSVVFDRHLAYSLDLSPIRLSLRYPKYRTTLFHDDPNRTIQLSGEIQKNVGGKICFEVSDASGKIIKQEEIPAQPDVTVSIDVSQWEFGRYRIAAKTAEGSTRAAELAVTLAPPPAQGGVVRMDTDKQLIVNGKRFFPLGFIGGDYREEMLLAAKAGYNVMHSYVLNMSSLPDIQAALDRAQAAGMKVMFYPFHQLAVGFWGIQENGKYRADKETLRPEERQRMINLVNAVKGHPALLGYYLCDEPRGAVWIKTLEETYSLLRELDPYHPVIALDNSVSGALAQGAHADIVVLDLYPNPQANGALRTPLAAIIAGNAALTHGLPEQGTWFCPQAFDYNGWPNKVYDGDNRAPTYRETRCTVWGALATGATAIVPYNLGLAKTQYFVSNHNPGIFFAPELHLGYLQGIGPELKALEKVLLSPRQVIRVSPESLYGIAFDTPEHRFIAAVNPDNKTVKGSVTPGKESAQWKVLGEKRRVKPEKGVIVDEFGPYAVHIYTDDPEFADPVDIAGLEAEISRTTGEALKKLNHQNAK